MAAKNPDVKIFIIITFHCLAKLLSRLKTLCFKFSVNIDADFQCLPGIPSGFSAGFPLCDYSSTN